MAFNNRLLRALSPADQEILRPHLRWSELERGTVLVSPDEPITHVWFPESGLTSIIAMAGTDQGIEVGLAGRDGLVGMPLVLDADRTPHRIFMQVTGAGYRINGDLFRTVLDDHAGIRKLLLRYVQAYSTQTTYTVEERLARWLLMSHDRQDTDEIPLTHDFLALMLGVRRPSVTIALHSLEGLGFVKATRGLVLVRKREELEEFAGAGYGVPEAEYERLIGQLR